jgi:hypothetical protein
LIVPEAMDKLQALRTKLGKPMVINSGYRSPKHNRAVGGAKGSKHMLGIAFDVRMDNHDPATYIAAALAVGFNGIGTYPRQGFVHVDARATRASWGDQFPKRKATPEFAPEEPRPPASRPPIAPPADYVIETPKSKHEAQDVLTQAPSFWAALVKLFAQLFLRKS